MEFRVAPAARGSAWLSAAFQIFRKDPAAWMIASVAAAAIVLTLSAIPFFGGFLIAVVPYILQAGVLRGLSEVEQGKAFRVEMLFDGFKHDWQTLLIFGVVVMVLNWVLIGVAALVFAVVSPLSLMEIVQLLQDKGKIMDVAVLLGLPAAASFFFYLLLSVPLLMAGFFAPPLIVLGKQSIGDAMKLSFTAVAKNWLPLSVYGILVTLLLLGAVLTLGLGFLVVLPMMQISIYLAYREIFDGVARQA